VLVLGLESLVPVPTIAPNDEERDDRDYDEERGYSTNYACNRRISDQPNTKKQTEDGTYHRR